MCKAFTLISGLPSDWGRSHSLWWASLWSCRSASPGTWAVRSGSCWWPPLRPELWACRTRAWSDWNSSKASAKRGPESGWAACCPEVTDLGSECLEILSKFAWKRTKFNFRAKIKTTQPGFEPGWTCWEWGRVWNGYLVAKIMFLRLRCSFWSECWRDTQSPRGLAGNSVSHR